MRILAKKICFADLGIEKCYYEKHLPYQELSNHTFLIKTSKIRPRLGVFNFMPIRGSIVFILFVNCPQILPCANNSEAGMFLYLLVIFESLK